MISVGATVVGVGRTIRGSWLGEVASVDPNGISRCGLNGSWRVSIGGPNGDDCCRHIISAQCDSESYVGLRVLRRKK